MLDMVQDTPSIPLDRLGGSKTQLMTDLSRLVENRGSALLMIIQCPWCAEVTLSTFLSLGSLQTRILRGTQLCTSQDLMNGILLSRTLDTHLVMGSLLGPLTPWNGLFLTLTLMNLGITPIGQSKLSISWMIHPNK